MYNARTRFFANELAVVRAQGRAAADLGHVVSGAAVALRGPSLLLSAGPSALPALPFSPPQEGNDVDTDNAHTERLRYQLVGCSGAAGQLGKAAGAHCRFAEPPGVTVL